MFWTHRIYDQYIGGHLYEVHKYWLPYNFDKRFKVLKKYFRVMNRENIPDVYKRRKSDVEVAETAIILLSRLAQLMEMDVPFALGSQYLSRMPWAVFGDCHLEGIFNFNDFGELSDHYYHSILNGGNGPDKLHFRLFPLLPDQLADKYNKTTHYIIALSMFVLYDVIMYCGPDCDLVKDVFNNDMRDKTVDLEKWQNLRCNVMGKEGRIREKPYKYKLGQVCHPKVPLESRIDFELVADSDDLALGEKLNKIELFKQPEEEPLVDDDTVPPEQDEEYQQRVAERIDKVECLRGAFCQ